MRTRPLACLASGTRSTGGDYDGGSRRHPSLLLPFLLGTDSIETSPLWLHLMRIKWKPFETVISVAEGGGLKLVWQISVPFARLDFL